MSRVKGKNTKPELIVRHFLHRNGFRYRLHRKDLPGKPDILLKKYNTAIFIHGCFWHGHKGCRYFVMPKTRTRWWQDKINRNREKDIENEQNLHNSGWKIIIIWECELKKNKVKATLKNLLQKLNS